MRGSGIWRQLEDETDMRMIDSRTTFLDPGVVVDDWRIACRHREQQCPLDRPKRPQYPGRRPGGT